MGLDSGGKFKNPLVIAFTAAVTIFIAVLMLLVYSENDGPEFESIEVDGPTTAPMANPIGNPPN